MTSDRARALARQLVARADALLEDTVDSEDQQQSGQLQFAGFGPKGWLPATSIVLLLEVALVGSIVAAAVTALRGGPSDSANFGITLLRISGAWALAFMPGWFFVRYLTVRLPMIWDKYVTNLYRLEIDRPGNLPRPALNSPFYGKWVSDGGRERSRHSNVYRQKFDLQYGRSVSAIAMDRRRRVRAETMVPVLVVSSGLSVGWTLILWQAPPVDLDTGGESLWLDLGFGFAGAYTYGALMIVHRFFRNDLRGAAYGAFAARVVVVLLLATAIQPLLHYLGTEPRASALLMFALGIFPVWVLRRMLRLLGAAFVRRFIPSLRSRYPLSDLDGMTVWYESRLFEEGIEDMHSLAEANLVDLILQTDVPITRLIDWIDQAYLRVHASELGQDAPAKLRQFGIRTATDLVRILDDKTRPRSETAVTQALAAEGLDPTAIRVLARTLSDEPGLRVIENWKMGSRLRTTAADRPQPAQAQNDSAASSRRSAR